VGFVLHAHSDWDCHSDNHDCGYRWDHWDQMSGAKVFMSTLI